MKVLLRLSFFIFFLLVLLAEADLCAQWNKVAPDLFSYFDSGTQGIQTEGGSGVITFSNGILWAGVRSLFSSNDTGKSWQKISFPNLSTTIIRDIDFMDRWHGVVATSDEGVLRTDDGGITWKTILSTTGDILKASFNGSTKIIHALGVDQGICYSSLDGGANWNQSFIGPYVSCLAISPNRTVYVFAQQKYQSSTQGWISYSTDLGSTWIKSVGLTDGDSYTLAVDSCDPNTLYLANEDWVSPLDWFSQIFVTSDLGDSWKAFDAKPVPYLCGSLATTTHVLFAGTTSEDGVIRSTDKGVTWKSIGGPIVENDSRAVATVNDNIIFALDTRGTVWVTFNSGGDLLAPVPPRAIMRFSSARIINDSQNVTIHLPIYLHRSGITEFGAAMILHYPVNHALTFLDATLYNGKNFDVAGSSTPGRAELSIPASDLNAVTDSLLGFANFLWIPGEISCNEIDFDSVRAVDPCSKTETLAFQGIIGSVASCNFSGVSEISPIAAANIFSFSPNPATEYGMVSSEIYSGNILLKLYDISGKLITSFEGSVLPANPLRISLANLSAGLYHLCITGGRTEYGISFIRK